MDIATDKSGQRIRAKNAHRGGDYVCAECRIKVLYAAGSTQVPHFKHFPRTPAESKRIKTCQLYVADQQGYYGASLQNRPERPPLPRPRLAFTWAGKGQDRQRWALVVTLPIPPHEVSFLKTSENLNGEVEVPRAQAIAQRSVWVKARSIQYEVIGFDKSRLPVWRPQPTNLLRADQPNVFNAGVNGGVQLEPDAGLVRGRTYLALSLRAASKPPPERFSRPVYRLDACDPRGEWQGYLVYIPGNRNPDIERWAESVFTRPIVDPPPRVDLVLPPVRQIGPDGAYELDEGQEVVLAVSGEDWGDTILEITDEATGKSPEWPVEVFDGGYLSLGALSPGRFTIHLRDREYVSIRIVVLPRARPVVTGVILRTVSSKGGPEFEAPVLSCEASERWSNLFSGGELFRGIDVPDGWPVHLAWRSKKEGERVASDLILPSAVAEAMEQCLQASPDSVVLDAGPFGQLAWQRPSAPAVFDSTEIALPISFANRLSWILNAQRSLAGPRVSLDHSIRAAQLHRVPQSHARLIAEFFDTPGWPPMLLPHARSLGRELAYRLK